MLFKQMMSRKSIHVLLDEMAGDHRLRRVLGPVALTCLGVGAIIGAGIFVATGAAASEKAGPALMVSYAYAGIACIFAALCYAEFASMAPVAGSAYAYAYTTLGELFAWIIGWDLVLEYAVGAATVANGWSGYFQSLLPKWLIPIVLTAAPYKYDQGTFLPSVVADYDKAHVATPIEQESAKVEVVQSMVDSDKALWADNIRKPAKGVFWTLKKKAKIDGGEQTVVVGPVDDATIESRITNRQQPIVNFPAVVIVAIVTVVLIKGIRESASFNALMVAIKVAAVVFVIAVGSYFVDPANWQPFAPFGWWGIDLVGLDPIGQTNQGGEPVGVFAGAAIIFFAYIGFDSVSTHAEEARNPQRDVPIGIITSLIVCTILYIAVVAVLTGMIPYDQISKDAGVSDAFAQKGLEWAKVIIATAGVAGITSVLLVMMLSAPRVFLAMARDGLIPSKFFADVHPTYRTPWKSTILVGLFVATLAGLLPIDALLHLTNIGTLFAFTVVCAAVLIMRRTNPQLPRPFRCPFVPLVPILGILSCLVLMFSLPAENWWRLFAWLAIGLVIYMLYGRRHSLLGIELRRELGKHGVSPAGSPADGP